MAQIFTDEGLAFILNQIITSSPVTVTDLYVGLFTDGNGSEVPDATAVLGSGYTEQAGSGYDRQVVTFGTPAISSTSILTTTLDGAANAGTYVVTVNSTAGLVVGMNIVVGSEGYKVITGLPGMNQVVLSSAIGSTQSNGATVTAGDAVNGVKTLGSQVTFSATGPWDASTGYFIADSMDDSGNSFYFSNFADNSTPTLAANDTLKVTPTWLMSN
jgi:hypothetical protein